VSTITIVGLSHRTAPLEVREKFVIEGDAARDALRRLAAAGCGEAVLLSTCNRTELYLRADSHANARALAVRFLSGHAGINETDADAYMYQMFDEHAIEHLFRVVGSLDSMVIGEAQIQGQVRTAYELARREGVLAGAVMPRLFETALRVGGRIRNETRLGTGAASIPSAALELARKIFGSLKGRSALVIGAGEMSELTVRCLRDEGVSNVSVMNRTESRAHEIAALLNARAISFAALGAELQNVDIVVTATAAPHIVLTRATVEQALGSTRDRPLLILDIALPRDVEESVGDLDNVFLYDIDDLSQVIEGNLEKRRSEIEAAQAIVAAEAADFQRWYRSREVVPVIRELRGWAEEVRSTETERTLRSLSHLAPEDRAAIDTLTKQLMAKFLHAPMSRLRDAYADQPLGGAGGAVPGDGRDADVHQGNDTGIAEVARYLFGLDVDTDAEELATKGVDSDEG
jgi:glutamyl-tRNA reductase